MIEKINTTKIRFSEKINKTDNPLARPIKEKKEKTQSIKLKMKKKKLEQTTQKYKRS